MKLADRFLQIVLMLVAIYLLVRYWKGATEVIRQSGSSTAGIIKTLQGR
jgi:hypothetical protein